MKRFLIQREMDGIGDAPRNDLNNAGKGSEEVLETMRSEGKNIQQEQSYVFRDTIFASIWQMLVSIFIFLIKINFINPYS